MGWLEFQRCFKFDNLEAANAFIDSDLPISVGGSYGGASSCLEIEDGGDEFLICDLGSGAWTFGLDALRRIGEGRQKIFHILMSHFHRDHIMGFPLFGPAYDPEVTIQF